MLNGIHRLPLSIVFFGLFISSLVYLPSDFLFDMRLRMIPGTPPYSFWADSPDNIIAKVYIFNITNSERFLDGRDDYIQLQEIGPITYREKFTHSNIVFNENSTLTYTITRNLIYLPERNTVDLNETIVAPNLAMLVMASYFSESSFFVKTGVNFLLRQYESKPFVNMTIYNYLHNATDPVLKAARALASGLVPSTNVGVLSQMYMKNEYNITVSIGTKYGNDEFFAIQNIDGIESVPTFKRCKPKFNRTSETTLFPQFLKKGGKINAWKAVLCMAVDAVYVSEASRYGMSGYKYEIPPSTFNRTKPDYEDCYRGNPVLPNGLADVSSCYSNYPFAASFPHFMVAEPIVFNKLKGLRPEEEKHKSFLLLEKMSGIPMGGRAIFQINAIFKDMSGFSPELKRFSNMYLPFAYVGYEVEGLPWHIYSFLYIMTQIVPNTQFFMSLIFMALGIYFLYVFYKSIRKPKALKTVCEIKDENEKFIKI
ncbi:lysosome membrane protein 2-like isoform X2 [Anthonomus grandis grandis]|uniref:lysosome membrane protein 2-like isoform X2 n=1 Tax=Anthonomus grandis grandis TaxID=2921223 RepID=UPI00216614DD|nr:lysosome membrane protein 2-like isoform X2 [Anthonomus grandis grandis]